MSQEITFTLPAIPAAVIAELAETETLLASTSVELIAALRAKFGPLASLNGFVKISDYSIGNQNWSESGSTYLRDSGGKKIKALLADDDFQQPNTSEYAGQNTGSRLFVTADGWIRITRTGKWSRWQGAPAYWTCDGLFANGQEFRDAEDGSTCGSGGDIRHMSDVEVAAAYNVVEVAKGLASSLTELAAKIPERLTRKRALAESLAATVAAMKGGK